MPAATSDEDLHAYVDGQLSRGDVERVEGRLAADPAMRDRAEAYARHKMLLRAALRAEATNARDETREMAERLEKRLKAPRAPLVRRLAAAAAIFATGFASYPMLLAYQEWRVPAIVEAAAKAHEMFGNDTRRPVELPASSQREMAAWFTEHLGAEVQIPDLRSLGLRFVGGRLLSSAQGPMVKLLYQDRGGERLSMYLSGEDTGSGSDVRVVHIDDYAAGYWQDGDLTYTIIAEMEIEQLRALASRMTGNWSFPRL